MYGGLDRSTLLETLPPSGINPSNVFSELPKVSDYSIINGHIWGGGECPGCCTWGRPRCPGEHDWQDGFLQQVGEEDLLGAVVRHEGLGGETAEDHTTGGNSLVNPSNGHFW